MVDSESKVPGIWFHLAGHAEREPNNGVLNITCTLVGTTTDPVLWPKIEKKLREGFRIYSELDFQTEVLLVMRDDFQKETQAHNATKHALELANARLAGVEAQLAEYKRLLGTLGSALGKR